MISKIKSVTAGYIESGSFPFPLWAGYLTNVVVWILFVNTFNGFIEFVSGVLCLFCVYAGYIHKELKTKPMMGLSSFSASWLIWISAIDAIWMFSWAFGIEGLLGL